MPKALEDCVTAVMKSGKPRDTAYAICTTKLQDAGVLKPGTRELAAMEGDREFVLDDVIIESAILEDTSEDLPNTVWIGEQREPVVLQTIVVSRKKADTAAEARKIAKDFVDGPMKAVDETQESFRFRVRDPGLFDPDIFKTIHPADGVAVVLGKLK